MKYISICSGIEAVSCAWEGLGFIPVAFSEIEPFPCSVLAHHYPDVPNLGDMTKPDWSQYAGLVDLVVGGTPCQAFSIAGLRGGTADARGNLTLKFVEICDAVRPSIVLWENVPGVLSSKDNAFGCFLAGLAGETVPLVAPRGKWANAGWVLGPERTIAWRVLDAQYFGVAQRRRRVFVVACSGGIDAREILFEREGVRRDIAPSREAGKDIAKCLTRGVGQRYDFESDTFPVKQWPVDCVSTLCASFGSKYGQKNQHINDGAPLFVPTYPTLAIGGRPNPVNDARMTMGVGGDGDPQFTLQANHSHAVAFGGDVARSLYARHDGSPCIDRGPDVVFAQSGVRRLTPRECERLQGFPDDYTLIPHKGKPSLDAPRYKALGNSMAVPVIRWLGKRILEHGVENVSI